MNESTDLAINAANKAGVETSKTFDITLEEAEAIHSMIDTLNRTRGANMEKLTLYRAENLTDNLGDRVPSVLEGIKTAPGWIKTAIESLAEQIKFEGWKAPNTQRHALERVVKQNALESEVKAIVLDALVFGVSMVSVARGNPKEGEAEVLVISESVLNTTVKMNPRTRTPQYGLKVMEIRKGATIGELYTRNEVIPFVVIGGSEGLKIVNGEPSGVIGLGERYTHGIGIVPIIPVLNRRDNLSANLGLGAHSEISQGMRNALSSAQRVIRRIEIQSKYHSDPQNVLLNVSRDAAEADANGGALNIRSNQYQIFFSQPEEDGPIKPHTWDAASPDGQLSAFKLFQASFASEAAIPPERLGGASTVNPSSAEALRSQKDALLSRADSRIVDLSAGLSVVGNVISRILEIAGVGDETWSTVEAKFVDPKAPTLAQATDAITKQVAAGIIDPRSRVTLERLGYSREEIARIEDDNVETNLSNTLENLLQAAEQGVGTGYDASKMDKNGEPQ